MTPVDVPYIVQIRRYSKLALIVGTKNWYRWPTLTPAEKSAILKPYKYPKPLKETPMIATAEPIWDKYLPTKRLDATGYKKFKLGQVWAVCTNPARPYIFRVGSDADGGYFNVTTLAGDSNVDFISENSTAAEHAVLLADPNELPRPGKFDFSPVAGTDHVKATAEEIVVRIMRKGAEHKKAGRNGQFSQVMVPMEDYQTLFEYFDVSKPPFDGEILVATPVGVVSVYPVNPDGATFTD